jgi:phosphomannomutase
VVQEGTATVETLSNVSERTGVRFGTSGVRGLVDSLSPDVCRAFTQAFLRASGLSGGGILIGQDLRPSSPAIAQACAHEAGLMGFAPMNAGALPTPALAFAAQCRGFPAIMVTGSHIPFERNGIKFYRPGGEISKDDEARILSEPVNLAEGPLAALPEANPGITKLYTERYIRGFGPRSLEGMRLGIYEHSSAARDLLHHILRGLGAETMSLGRSDDFVPIDTEAVRAEDRAVGRQWASQHRLDAILTTDGDADRPLMADERGEWLRGDVVGILSARALGARSVVTPVSSNTALEACGAFAETIRTRIGSPHVIAAMQATRHAPVVGYEANGGFLLGSDVTLNGRSLAALRTRDAVLPMIMVLLAARESRCTLSELVARLPRRFTFSDRLQNIDMAKCSALLAKLAQDASGFERLLGAHHRVSSLDLTDGVRVSLENGAIVHLRLSGNAPELRCYAEASSPEDAEALCKTCLSRVPS